MDRPFCICHSLLVLQAGNVRSPWAWLAPISLYNTHFAICISLRTLAQYGQNLATQSCLDKPVGYVARNGNEVALPGKFAQIFSLRDAPVQGSAKRLPPDCDNAAGRLRQKWYALAGTRFTRHGARLLAEPCIVFPKSGIMGFPRQNNFKSATRSVLVLSCVNHSQANVSRTNDSNHLTG